MEAKLEGRSSRKLYSVDHNRNSTLPGSSHFIRHNNSFTTISAPRLVDRWQFRSAKSASPENGMSEGGDGNSESFSLVGSLYQRMQGLVQEMLHSETGVPIRSHRHKLISVPSVFTGSDLVHWITKECNCSKVEAIHVANLLHTHGFLFGVETFDAVVKDDGTLFRFQTPHLWPSQRFDDSDFEYAVYLVKQVKRSKSRVRLEDYEMRDLRKLQKQLQPHWKDINMRADEEVRIMKDQKKIARALMESQDRAFWRIRRPPPNCHSISDYMLTKFCMRDTNHIQLIEKNLGEELSVLQNTSKLQRYRLSTTLDSMVGYCKRYAILDPMLDVPDPCNPWVSGDTTLWMLERSLVEYPTEKQAKKWSNSLADLLTDVTGRFRFEQFCKKQFCLENIKFWQACRDLKSLPLISIAGSVQLIYDEFIDKTARSLVNLSAAAKRDAEDSLNSPSRYSFFLAQEEVYKLMETDIYPRFLKSPEYAAMMKPLENGGSYSKGFFKKLMPSRTRSTNPRIHAQVNPTMAAEIVSPCHPQRFTRRQLSISQRHSSTSPETQDDMFLSLSCFIPSDSQSYHEGLSDLPSKGDTVKVTPTRRVSEPQAPVFTLQGHSVESDNLWSVTEDTEEVVMMRNSHLVSHTQSMEELRPRPLSHVLSLPTSQVDEDTMAKSMVPNLSILDDDYELSRNMSSSMENLLFIASPESTFERTMSATASLPSYRMAKGNAEDNNVLLPRTPAEFAAETDVTLEIPSPGHSSTTSSHSSASVS